MPRRALLAISLSLISVAPAVAQSFLGLGYLPGDNKSFGTGVSGDGRVAVGFSECEQDAMRTAFLWSVQNGAMDLGSLPGGNGFGEATATSADGTAVAGWGVSEHDEEAFLWRPGEGMLGLGDLPGGMWGSIGWAVSADGVVVVGQSFSAQGLQAFRWNAEDGMAGLGDLPGGSFQSRALGVSADGSVIVGDGVGTLGPEAFRWTAEGGLQGLGDLPGHWFSSRAYAVSADGGVVVGSSWSEAGQQAFRWTSQTGMIGLGDLPGGVFVSEALATNSDGSVIVGYSWSAERGREPFYWTPSLSMVSLAARLTDKYGLDLSGWDLQEATSVSSDGRTIVGWGINPAGHTEGWIATISSACMADLTDDDVLDLFDLLAFTNLFNANDPRADCDQNGELDLFDFLCFVNAFNAGC